MEKKFYDGEAFPKDFYENEDSYKTVDESEKDKTVYKSKKNGRFLPSQLINLLPPIAAQLLYYLFSSTLRSDGKGYFYPMTFKYIKMTEDDFDASIQTLIDNGIINVIRIDERVYEYIVNYDKINEFVFPFKEMLNIEKIKLSTDITFRNINTNSSNCESNDLQLNELAMKLTSSERSKLMDMLMVLRAKEMNGEDSLFGEKERQRKVRDEIASEFFRLSNKNV